MVCAVSNNGSNSSTFRQHEMMTRFPTDIFHEPDEVDFDTLKNLGPLAPLAGIWEGQRGLDVHLGEEGSKKDAFHERYELQPIDPQLNGRHALWVALLDACAAETAGNVP
jgi:hypothetical protein